ncbi:hypothetical protein Rhe02_12290 [Rhizocola hellebori]|uniref:Uncharacterized protein n=1 Tax=Rhizocola hellebori TaxID=1392758 RepID=A0A8J3VE99_9ACTN|nr:hypothetical protein [Rhizocola hellebori]GIH03162.1 hypothetical protein Rhe02_12290 [Rhizocola hellebori]
MTGETLQEIHRRLGLPEIPQEAIDKAREQIREHEQRMADPERRAARKAESEALLAQFRRPKVRMLPGESLPELHRRLGLPEIPQEAIDKARRDFAEQERILADPVRKAARLAESEALLARFRRPAR